MSEENLTDTRTDRRVPIAVAVVEDDPATRARIVESVRADAELALVGDYASAGEAIAGIARATPDLLLVDLGLPDMPGLELIRVVSKGHPDCDILVFTAFGDEAHVLASLEAGARGYLLKGQLARDIGLDIRDVKNGGSPLSPLIARHLLKRLEDVKPKSPAPESETGVLSPRERDVLNAISRGYTYAETAELMGIGAATVHSHLKRIYRKLEVSSKTEAVFEANRLGLL